MNDKESVFFLAEQRDFGALNSREQALVLQVMNQEEFEELHQSIRASRFFFEAQEVIVNSSIKPKLNQAFQTKYATAKTLWIKRSIPLWQAAAACFLVALFSWIFLHSNATETITERVYVYQTDTIFQDAPIINEKPQSTPRNFIKNPTKSFPVVAKRNQKPSYEAAAIPITFELEKLPKINDSIVVFQSKMGQSVKDDTLLMSWGGVMF